MVKKLSTLFITLVSAIIIILPINTHAAGVVTPGVTYSSHVQNIGWQNAAVNGGESGTDGKSLRLEAIKINLTGTLPAGAGITYQTQVQNIGWQGRVSNGAEAGTNGRGLREEAIRINLVNLPGYSVQYRVHVQNVGWQDWVSDGALAGTVGRSLRLEALEIRIVKAAIKTGWVDYGNGDWHFLRSDGTVADDITPNHVTVGKARCAYSSIQQAINSVPNCLITLVIYPGTYNEHVVLIGRNISLQGINKDTCIIQDDSGNYYNSPLSASGNGNISNLTFISTHNNANYTIPGYALHCDYAGAGTLTFTNCSFTSYQNSAIGIGMHQSQTLVFDNCDIRKNASYNGGAFYCHNDVGNNVTNQHIIVKNSRLTTNIGVAIRVDDASTYNHNSNSQMDIGFYNNILSSDQMGTTNSIVYFRDNPLNGGICGQIKLTKDSSGNNVSVLNYANVVAVTNQSKPVTTVVKPMIKTSTIIKVIPKAVTKTVVTSIVKTVSKTTTQNSTNTTIIVDANKK